MLSGDEPPCTLAGVFGPSVRVSIRTTNRARGATGQRTRQRAREFALDPGRGPITDVRSQGGHIDANSAKSGAVARERILRQDRHGQHKPV